MKEFNYSPRCKNPYQGLHNCNSIARVLNDNVTVYYSYAEPIAVQVVKHNITFMTTRKWSVTTSKHQTFARCSCSGRIKMLDHDLFTDLVHAVQDNKNVTKAVLQTILEEHNEN